MSVEDSGKMDVGGATLHYVIGRTVAKPPGATAKNAKPVEMKTFLGGADTKDPKTEVFIMGQQPDPTKTLTMEEIKAFLSMIRAI